MKAVIVVLDGGRQPDLFRAVVGHDQPLRLGQLLQADFGSPPVVVANPDGFILSDLGQLVGAGAHRQPLLQVEILESGRVFDIFPDMFGDKIVDTADVIGETLQLETHIRLLKVVDDRQIIDLYDRLDPLLVGEVLAQRLVAHLQLGRKDDIVRCEGRTVMPGDAWAQFERPDGVILVGCEGLGQPVFDFAAAVVQQCQHIRKLRIAPPHCTAAHVGIPVVTALQRAGPVQDDRLRTRSIEIVFRRTHLLRLALAVCGRRLRGRRRLWRCAARRQQDRK